MTLDRIDRTGFAPHGCERVGHRSTAFAQLVASAALALSIAVAATVVSIGIARAEGLAGADRANASVAAAIVVAIVLVGMVGLTAWVNRGRARAEPGE